MCINHQPKLQIVLRPASHPIAAALKENVFTLAMAALSSNTDVITMTRAIKLLDQLILNTIETPLGSFSWIERANFLSAQTGQEVTDLAITLLNTYSEFCAFCV
jgi:hypothetical protein